MIPDELKVNLLSKPLNESTAKSIQINAFIWTEINPIFNKNIQKKLEEIDIVAAVDVSYPPTDDPVCGIAGIVLWDRKKKEEIFHIEVPIDTTFPYIPGFLGFREVPPLFAQISKLDIIPDIIICDGHGQIHPRRMGEAVHLSLVSSLSTIGVAKSPFYGQILCEELNSKKGSKSAIYPPNKPDEVIGYLLRTREGGNPVYVSRGLGISLEDASTLILELTDKHRLPEPLYLADHYSRIRLKEILEKRNPSDFLP